MMKGLILFCLLAAANPFKAQVTIDGGLKIEDFKVCFGGKVADKNLTVDAPFEENASSSRDFSVKSSKTVLFSGKSDWRRLDDGSLEGIFAVRCEKDTDIQELSPRIAIPHSAYPGCGWEAKGTSMKMGDKGFYRNMTCKDFTLNLGNGKIIRFSFDSPTQVKLKDGSSKTGLWYVKFGMVQGPMPVLKGDGFSVKVRVSSPSGLELSNYRNYEISASENWIPIENCKDFESGSALDFSGMGFQDAPAGKHGWLKNVGGEFEFEGLPGVPQRFCGANLCGTASSISHELADTLVRRFVALGYNAVRIHHHDRYFDIPEYWDKLDYLIAKFIENGIYITTDMYVSRSVNYKDIGLPEEGAMLKGLYKQLIVCYEPAFQDWCKYSAMFLEHVNPYTGRAYKNEPGIPFISLINEGTVRNCGNKNYPPIFEEWRKWGGEGKLAWNSPRFDEFEEYMTEKAFRKCSEYIRSLGGRALLTNDNNGKKHGEMEGATKLYDYVDNHFYMDHHKFFGTRYKLPSRIENVNMVENGGPDMLKKNNVRTSAKPYTITEWNYCGPNMYRGMAGLLVGSLTAINGWDGIWRFAYSHSDRDIAFNPESFPSTFNLATDPLNIASERATVMLFLRRDISDKNGFSMDRKTGTLKVTSGKTCGFYSATGGAEAGALRADVRDVPASIWVSSLDNKAIEESGRLLLVHLTDVQGDGIRFATDERQIVLKWGGRTLVEKGRAAVSLKLESPEKYSVYGLSQSGHRVARLKTKAAAGRLEFETSTSGAEGGCLYYEIVKE